MIKLKTAVHTFFLFLIPFLLTASPDSAAVKTAADTIWQSTKGSGGSNQFYTVFLMTALLLLVLVSGAYIYKKLGGKSKFIGKSDIRILSRRHLGPKQSIVIAVIENKKYALGITEQSINLIADLGEASDLETDEEESKIQGRGFGSILELLKKDKQ